MGPTRSNYKMGLERTSFLEEDDASIPVTVAIEGIIQGLNQDMQENSVATGGRWKLVVVLMEV